MRNIFLTRAMENVLRIMRDEEEYIIVEGAEAWVGSHKTNVATVHHLLRLCLVSQEQGPGEDKIQHYNINEDGRKVLEDPLYTPRIVKELQKRGGKK